MGWGPGIPTCWVAGKELESGCHYKEPVYLLYAHIMATWFQFSVPSSNAD